VKTSVTFVIDSNQYIQDFSTKGVAFRKLLRYLDTTDSSLIMPEVVWEEVASKFVARRSEIEAEFRLKADEFGRLASLSDENVDEPSSSLRQPSVLGVRERFCAALKSRLKLDRRHFVVVDAQILQRAWQRCLSKRAPFKKNGDGGFKDAVLWESTLSLASRHDSFRQSPIVFISANTTDFADTRVSDTPTLRSELADEARAAGLEIEFYPSITRFFQSRQEFDSLLSEDSQMHHIALKGFEWKLKDFFRRFLENSPSLRQLVAKSLNVASTSVPIVLRVSIRNLVGTVEQTGSERASWSLLATAEVGMTFSPANVLFTGAPHLSSEWEVAAEGLTSNDGTESVISKVESANLVRAYAA
jgi:predicted nucleic acid-binding protein